MTPRCSGVQRIPLSLLSCAAIIAVIAAIIVPLSALSARVLYCTRTTELRNKKGGLVSLTAAFFFCSNMILTVKVGISYQNRK